jgi:protein-S-isoprenylcysteine O-methyltransferase Ste14
VTFNINLHSGGEMTTSKANSGIVKKSFWIAFAFYFVIAFEFMYMVSPFAVYFYSVYEPGLNFINSHSSLGWLSNTFLPHFIAHTSSSLLKVVGQVGVVLALGGLTAFLVGMIHVYYYKLTGKKAVTRGVYRFVRHPQYLALAVSGFGMLLIWPRYLVLLSYITMLFFYYFLAVIEEAECIRKFGEPYRLYLQKTGRFLPLRLRITKQISILPAKGLRRYLVILLIYLISCATGIVAANWIKDWSLDKIYALYQKDSVTISVTRLSQESISQILHLAKSHPGVEQMQKEMDKKPVKTLNYIVPTDWSASEIPMNPVSTREQDVDSPHGYPEDKIIDLYKVVFTKAIQRNNNDSFGKEIMHHTVARIPLMEVIIDLPNNKVLQVNGPVENRKLEGVPLPLY